MKRNMTLPFTLLLLTYLVSHLFAQSNTHTIQSEFDRCISEVERIERSIRKNDDALINIKRQTKNVSSEKKESFLRDMTTLENRLVYFQNRLERLRGQSDKLRDDLKNSGPVCPSCIESGVNLFCRNGKGLQNDLDDFSMKINDLQESIGFKKAASVKPDNDTKNFESYRTNVYNLLNITQNMLQSCDDKSATMLYKQARITINRADSLSENDTISALKSLDIAQSLLEKVTSRCGKK